MEFELGLDKFRFKTEIDELIRIIQILKTTLDSKSKKILKELLEEIEKIFSKIVDTIYPLYELNNNMNFEKEFGNRYMNFKKFYLQDLSDVGYSCNVAKDKLDQLMKNQGWKSNTFRQLSNPFRRKNKDDDNEKYLRELENLLNNWYTQDRIVYAQIDQLQRQLNDGLDQVNALFTNGNTNESLQKLQSFLKNSEKFFFELKKSFQQLKQIGNELN